MDFQKKYDSILKTNKTSASLLTILASFAKPNSDEVQEKAQKKLNSKISENEPFSNFVILISAVADNASYNTEVRSCQKDKTFKNKLTNSSKRFLRDAGKFDGTVEEMATHLDNMHKHIFIPSVNAIGEAKFTAEFEKMIEERDDREDKLYQQSIQRPDTKYWILNKFSKPIRYSKCGESGHYRVCMSRNCTTIEKQWTKN